MGETEDYGDDGPQGQETTGDAGRRSHQLRSQAELAWGRVQRVLQPGREPSRLPGELLDRIEQVPASTYVSGIAASFFISAFLLALGRRSSSTLVGLGGPLLLGGALYLKAARQARRI